jgi:hypothetical protein
MGFAIVVAAMWRRKVAKLQEVLADETTRPQAVEIIRSLLDRIEVRPGQERGHCEVMVAGTGFVQERTRWELRKAV